MLLPIFPKDRKRFAHNLEQKSNLSNHFHFIAQVLALHKNLLEAAKKRESRLQDNCQLQQFLRDVEEINAWIKEKRKTASDEAYRVRDIQV